VTGKTNQPIAGQSFMNPCHGIVVGAIDGIELNQLIFKCCSPCVLHTGIWQKITIFELAKVIFL